MREELPVHAAASMSRPNAIETRTEGVSATTGIACTRPTGGEQRARPYVIDERFGERAA
jgi:hypothetical protein